MIAVYETAYGIFLLPRALECFTNVWFALPKLNPAVIAGYVPAAGTAGCQPAHIDAAGISACGVRFSFREMGMGWPNVAIFDHALATFLAT